MAVWQPAWQVLVAFNNTAADNTTAITTVASPAGTLGAHNVWTDITADVRTNVDTNRGRQHETDSVQSGTLTFTLDNTTGKYDPWSASSPYAGLVAPGKPCRLQATYSAVTYVLYTGITDVWATQWTSPSYATASVSCVDLLAYLNNTYINATDYYPTVVAADGAAHLWRMSEPDGDIAADTIGSATARLYLTYALGQPGPLMSDTSTGIQLGVPASANALALVQTSVNLAADFTVEGWVQHTAVPSARSYLWYQQFNALSVWVDTNGHAGWTWQFDSQGTTNICDGKWHHLAVTYVFGTSTLTLYVDGAVQQTGFSGTAFSSAYAVIGAADWANPAGYGNVADIAIYAAALSPTQVATHYQLGNVPSEKSGTRIARISTWLGIPQGTVETGNTNVQAITTSPAQTSVLSYFQTVERSEAGLLAADKAGLLAFQSRGTVYSNTTPTVTFGDNFGGGEIPFMLGPQIATDTQDSYGQVVLQRTNGNPQTSPATGATFGSRTYTQSGLVNQSDRVVASYADWLYTQFAAAKPRIRQITIDGVVCAAAGGPAPSVLLALGLGSVVTVNRHTLPGGGTAFSQACNVEGINFHVYPETGGWNVELQLTPLPPRRPWILSTSQLSIDTNLFF